MPIELANPDAEMNEKVRDLEFLDIFEDVMEDLAECLVRRTISIEAQFAEIACHPDVIEQIILEEWMNNLSVRASRIRRARETGIPK
jgi:hypothetical protein